MPHFRMYIKLDGEPVKEYLVEDFRRDVDDVYKDYKQRVTEKNGSGRVIYFGLVMLAEASLLHLEDRMEVLHEGNAFGLKNTGTFKKGRKPRKGYEDKPTMGERVVK